MNASSQKNKAFTLVELLVVLGVISILVVGSMKFTVNMMTGNENQQCYYKFAQMVKDAKAHAFRTNNYVAICCEIAPHTKDDLDDKHCYLSVLSYNKSAKTFKTDDFGGAKYEQVPAGRAFLKINPNNSSSLLTGKLEDMSSFIVIFSPQGTLVTEIDGGQVSWEQPQRKEMGLNPFVKTGFGTQYVSPYNYRKAEFLTGVQRKNFLQGELELIRVNLQTGVIYDR